MGISKLTAMVIGGNYPYNIEINCICGINNKYAGFVFLLKDGLIHNIQISTDHVFDTPEEAKNKMDETCKELVEYCKKEGLLS